MKTSVKSVVKLPEKEKEIISFDKKGNRTVKKIKINNLYLVTLSSGNSVVLTSEQIRMYGIKCTLPDTKEEIVQKDEEDDTIDDEELLNEEETSENSSETETTNTSNTQVVNSSPINNG